MPKAMGFVRRLITGNNRFTPADIITAVIFLGILAFALFFFLRKNEYVYVTLFVSQDETYSPSSKPTAWYLDRIKPGPAFKDMLGRETLSIVDVYRYNSTTPTYQNDVYVRLKVRSIYSSKTKQYSYNGNPLLVGTFQIFRFPDFVLTGMIREIGNDTQNRQKIVTVHGFLDARNNDYPSKYERFIRTDAFDFDGIPLSISSKIEKGKRMVDSNGNTIAEIMELSKRPGTIRLFENNQINYLPDSQREYVEFSVKLQADAIDGNYFFQNEYPLAINNIIDLAFPDIIVYFTITGIDVN